MSRIGKSTETVSISGCQGPGLERWGMGRDCSLDRVSWGGWNVLKLGGGGGCTTVSVLKTTALHSRSGSYGK